MITSSNATTAGTQQHCHGYKNDRIQKHRADRIRDLLWFAAYHPFRTDAFTSWCVSHEFQQRLPRTTFVGQQRRLIKVSDCLVFLVAIRPARKSHARAMTHKTTAMIITTDYKTAIALFSSGEFWGILVSGTILKATQGI